MSNKDELTRLIQDLEADGYEVTNIITDTSEPMPTKVVAVEFTKTNNKRNQ